MKFLSQVLLSTAAIAGMFVGVAQNAIAQDTTPINPVTPSNNGTFQNNEIGAFDGLENGSFNPLDLFHRMNLGGRRSLGEFRQDQNNNLDNAAAEFRRRQMELLNNNGNAPTTPLPDNSENP
ncbi:MAG: hypothetical protein SAJ12_14545 [Jaaginema sp. PMC 1079.18]|nr:hypothetical protein [Jaaginema sp. PMC 1080.18]MEC4852203.1 hypothetical protein [Jaaginema sp. PMC 1079.18]MEC4865322.1 hypothetical protein [Jaaginema sp. PMC 1078.18]